MDKRKLKRLSEREVEVLRLFKRGLSNGEIAKRLKLTEHTIKKQHMRSIYKKLGIIGRLNIKGRRLAHLLCDCTI